MALQSAQIIRKNVEKTVYVRCDYPHLPEVLRLAKMHHAEIVVQDLQLDCRLTVRIPLADYTALTTAWQQMRVVDMQEEAFNQSNP